MNNARFTRFLLGHLGMTWSKPKQDIPGQCAGDIISRVTKAEIV